MPIDKQIKMVLSYVHKFSLVLIIVAISNSCFCHRGDYWEKNKYEFSFFVAINDFTTSSFPSIQTSSFWYKICSGRLSDTQDCTYGNSTS